MGQLYDRLIEYSKSDYYPFHMPGHKRNMEEGGFFNIDITEIDGFDDMHNPQGIIMDTLERISKFYESDKTYFLVNGSTCGLLTAISAAVKKKGKILIARNCHKSVYNAIYLNELDVRYVYPEIFSVEESANNFINGGIMPGEVERAILDEGDIEAVVITSPTYEGIVSDIKSIAAICHRHRIPLIVDEAHGAHFEMHDYFPVSALSLGADIVVQSLHKTMPALNQCALIHIKSNIVDIRRVEKFLSIYQTSSPSYVFMATMENAIEKVMTYGDAYFDEFAERIEKFRYDCRRFTHIKLLDYGVRGKSAVYDLDRTRLVIYAVANKMTGREIYNKLLHKYHIQMEMSTPGYAVAITSVNDTDEGFSRLFDALTEIDRELRLGPSLDKVAKAYSLNNTINARHIEEKVSSKGSEKIHLSFDNMKMVTYEKISEVEGKETEYLPLTESVGKIATDFVYIYPPGSPVIAPGEMINNYVVELILNYIRTGFSVNGISLENKRPHIRVVKEEFKKVKMSEIFGKKVFAQIDNKRTF
ncbi:MAG: aminotransferase class I/II-fold pyridoxal phosphate-dependent enzyme [Lachnospiraceae bacterium]|nr:aminotransferase class I/II-fold pyridoxal phosphate-dependent enzyme [Lachnospiraceae bacterium]